MCYLYAFYTICQNIGRISVKYFPFELLPETLLHKELKTLGALLPVFQNMAPELIQEASQVLDEVLEALAMDG